jgi:pectate lyase
LEKRVDRHGGGFLAALSARRKSRSWNPSPRRATIASIARGNGLSPGHPPVIIGSAVNAASSILILFLAFAAGGRAGSTDKLLDKPDAWFRGSEGRRATECILSWQSTAGSWPKNQDHCAKPFRGDRSKLKGTFDNGATTDELRYLARAFRATGDEVCRSAFLKGFDHILAAQYRNGGWPQFHPPGKQYHRHITFNDGSMVRLLEFLRESARFELIDDARHRRARAAFDRGVACILECQIVIRGRRTVWCAQHDELSLAPAAARSYELPSLSGSESAGILRFLMSIERPSPELVRAIDAGVAWFDAAKLGGIRVREVDGDRRLVADPLAPSLWARFYDLDTGRPFFCDRDGIKKSDFAELGKERRNGYAWFGRWGEAVARDHARWRRR